MMTSLVLGATPWEIEGGRDPHADVATGRPTTSAAICHGRASTVALGDEAAAHPQACNVPASPLMWFDRVDARPGRSPSPPSTVAYVARLTLAGEALPRWSVAGHAAHRFLVSLVLVALIAGLVVGVRGPSVGPLLSASGAEHWRRSRRHSSRSVVAFKTCFYQCSSALVRVPDDVGGPRTRSHRPRRRRNRAQQTSSPRA